MTKLTLISHHLCPYVQRAVIALTEKKVPFERVDIDLANKPDWFKARSPLGKTPVLKVGGAVIFESAVILEYLEETQPFPMHPQDPLQRAGHRSWIEFGSEVLNGIWGFYTAPDEAALAAQTKALSAKFEQLEHRLRKSNAVLASQEPAETVIGGVAIVRLARGEGFSYAGFVDKAIRSKGLIVEA